MLEMNLSIAGKLGRGKSIVFPSNFIFMYTDKNASGMILVI